VGFFYAVVKQKARLKRFSFFFLFLVSTLLVVVFHPALYGVSRTRPGLVSLIPLNSLTCLFSNVLGSPFCPSLCRLSSVSLSFLQNVLQYTLPTSSLAILSHILSSCISSPHTATFIHRPNIVVHIRGPTCTSSNHLQDGLPAVINLFCTRGTTLIHFCFCFYPFFYCNSLSLQDSPSINVTHTTPSLQFQHHSTLLHFRGRASRLFIHFLFYFLFLFLTPFLSSRLVQNPPRTPLISCFLLVMSYIALSPLPPCYTSYYHLASVVVSSVQQSTLSFAVSPFWVSHQTYPGPLAHSLNDDPFLTFRWP